jgi:hypothetical protein
LVTEGFIPRARLDRWVATKCEKNHIWLKIFTVFGLVIAVPPGTGGTEGNTAMKAKSAQSSARAGRANLSLALGLLLALAVTGSALAEPGTAEQRRACTPDVYRLCAGEIPNVRAITSCLRRHMASLSDACRAVFEQ